MPVLYPTILVDTINFMMTWLCNTSCMINSLFIAMINTYQAWSIVYHSWINIFYAWSAMNRWEIMRLWMIIVHIWMIIDQPHVHCYDQYWSFKQFVDHSHERLLIIHDQHWSLPWKTVDHIWSTLIGASYHDHFTIRLSMGVGNCELALRRRSSIVIVQLWLNVSSEAKRGGVAGISERSKVQGLRPDTAAPSVDVLCLATGSQKLQLKIADVMEVLERVDSTQLKKWWQWQFKWDRFIVHSRKF